LYKKHLNTPLMIGGLLLLMNGCISAPRHCASSAASHGTFCYQGYDFGIQKSGHYKLGIKHGCITANGHFVKLYRLSQTSAEYRHGWDKGRATCKLIPPSEADKSTMRTAYQQSIDEQKYYRD